MRCTSTRNRAAIRRDDRPLSSLPPTASADGDAREQSPKRIGRGAHLLKRMSPVGVVGDNPLGDASGRSGRLRAGSRCHRAVLAPKSLAGMAIPDRRSTFLAAQPESMRRC